MSDFVNAVVKVGTFGLVDDITGSEAAGEAGQAAAAVQAEAAQAGIQENRRQFDLNRADLQPRIQGGNEAFDQQRILLGLGSAPTSSGAPMGGSTSGRAGRRLSAEGFTPQGPSAPGPSAEEQQRQAFASFNESPGQRFLRDRAQKNLLRNASAIGGLGGGNVRTALVEQGAGFAQQDFNNQFARLGQLAGQGQNAANTSGQLGAQSASQIGNLQANQGAAQASGIIAPSQANTDATNQILQLGGTVVGANSDKIYDSLFS